MLYNVLFLILYSYARQDSSLLLFCKYIISGSFFRCQFPVVILFYDLELLCFVSVCLRFFYAAIEVVKQISQAILKAFSKYGYML